VLLILSFTVKVKVMDAEGEPVKDAFVYFREVGLRAYTDERGEGRIYLPAGNYSVVVQALGYKLYRTTVAVRGDTTFYFTLRPLTYTLREVEVSPKSRSAYGSSDPKFLEAMPFVGDQDVGYFISVAPGVVPVYGLAYFSVRGSSPFENLITYDGIPLFNAFSYYGMYTPINVDIVGGIKFLRGAFPPEVGNLSGALIDFRSASTDSFSGVVRVSRTNSGVALRGKGWVLSARVGLFAPIKAVKRLGTLTGDVSGKFSFGNSLRGLDFSFIANHSQNDYQNTYRGLFYSSRIFNGGAAMHGRWALGNVLLKPGIVYSTTLFESSDSSYRLPYITDYYIFNSDTRYELIRPYLEANFGGIVVGSEVQIINSHLNGIALSISDTALIIYYLHHVYPTKFFWGNFIKYRYEDANILSEVGVRLDRFSNLGFVLSPSGLFKYYPNNHWAFKIQGGKYRQFFTSIFAFPPSVFYYVPVERAPVESYQLMGGVERTFPWGISELTFFGKYYPRFTYMTTYLEEKVGKLYSFGADFWLRKESKLPLPLTADLSITLMNSRIRYEGDSVWYPTPWDVNVVSNLTLMGYIRRGEWEVTLGGTVAFYYGRPFRGIVSHWRDPFRGEQFIVDSTHSLRLPPYARVDIFWRSPLPFKLGPFSFDISFSVINLFPRKDVTFDPTNPDADLANLTASYPISSVVLRASW